MKWAMQRRARTLLVSGAILAVVIALVALLSIISRKRGRTILTPKKAVSSVAPLPSQTPNNSAEIQPTPPVIGSPDIKVGPLVPIAPSASPAELIIPVVGVRPEQLRDTFSEARSEGRVHDAIDIAAPHGTPVIAAADGPIVRLFQSERGGTTVYQLSTDEKFVYYYAHLDRYAEGLAEGHFAKQGETIAYVGDSGNAGSGNYHLHFSIAQISNPKDFWHGININPYPLLRK